MLRSGEPTNEAVESHINLAEVGAFPFTRKSPDSVRRKALRNTSDPQKGAQQPARAEAKTCITYFIPAFSLIYAECVGLVESDGHVQHAAPSDPRS